MLRSTVGLWLYIKPCKHGGRHICVNSWLPCRQHDGHVSLASRESSPDESLIAEGWIVAGTIMSNRDYKPGKLQGYVCMSTCWKSQHVCEHFTNMRRSHKHEHSYGQALP